MKTIEDQLKDHTSVVILAIKFVENRLHKREKRKKRTFN